MTVVYGIDPGLTGAIACISDGELLWVQDMPTVSKEIAVPLLQQIATQDVPPDVVGIEHVHAMPKNGSIANFKLGKAYGLALGVFAQLYPIQHITPGDWKKEFRLTGKDKEAARLCAIERWPAMATTYFGRKKDHNRADAALIGLHTFLTVTRQRHSEAA